MRKYITWLLVVIMVMGLIPSNLIVAKAASKEWQYAYLVSGVLLTLVRQEDGTLWYGGDGGNNEIKKNTNGSFTINTTGISFYKKEVKITGNGWSKGGEKFVFDNVKDAAAIQTKSKRFFGSNPDGSEAPTEGTFEELKYTKTGGKPIMESQNTGNGTASATRVTFQIICNVSAAEYSKLTVGKPKEYSVISVLEYKSAVKLADDSYSGSGGGGGGGTVEPEPEPDEPSEANISTSLDAEDRNINYMNFSGSVSATAYARDTSDYRDIGDLDELSVRLDAFDDRVTETSSREGGSAEAVLTGNISKSASWLDSMGDGRTYRYEASSLSKVSLTNGSSKRVTKDIYGFINLNNDAPSTSFSLKTNNLNGGDVANTFYYVNTPARITVRFADPEDDIERVFISLGLKTSMDSGFAQLIYSMTSGGSEENYSSASQITVTDVVKNINGYSATIVFKQPGVYKYEQQVIDGASNSRLARSTEASGTFVVRSEPAAPTAVISSPQYAFENEAFNVKQNSTDPNGVDDILYYNWTNTVDVTQENDPEAASDTTFKPITNVSNNWPGNGTINGKNGGTLTFPTGAAHHLFKIKLKVKDATNLTDETEQIIKVVSNVPVALLKPDVDLDKLKENRQIIISASDSLVPQSNPILWNEVTWKVEAISGGTASNINEDTSQKNGNKQLALQFNKPGVYRVTVSLVNKFSKDNPTHEDIAASTASVDINVVTDRAPLSNVSVISSKPNFIDNPTNHTVKFKVVSSSDDGDIITNTTSYNWVLYEDFNDNGVYEAGETIQQNRLTFNAEKTEVALDTSYAQGKHNKLKAVVTTTEKYSEKFIAKFLSSDGSHIRKTTVDAVEVVNWIPKPVILPPDSSNVKTPYEDVDIDGDGASDGKFIRSYTDDIFSVNTQITDEFPSTCKVTWELAKKEHNGTFNTKNGSTNWISSSNVIHTLGHNGGTVKINSPGIYRLKMMVADDVGDTAEHSIMIRIYTLPQAVLETNPTYQIQSHNTWGTKENIRFDIRSNPTIVDDEWGKAWHTMNWDLDNWDVKPVSGQGVEEIHFMNPQYTGRYNNVFPNDTAKFSGRNSPLGFGVVVDKPIDIIVVPGLLGNKKEDNEYQLDNIEKQKLYAAADDMANKLKAKDKRYNVKVYKTWAAQDTNDLFRTNEMYGFFDSFTNSQEDEQNLYTKSFSSNVNDNATNTGVNIVIADLDKMNADNCKFGELSLMSAHEESHPEVAGVKFSGAAKVYINGTLVSDCPDESTWDKMASIESLPDGTWKIQGNLGVSVICSGDTEIKTEFTGGTLWTSVATRGWAGIYNDEYKLVTHEKSILSTLQALNLRANSTKIVIYSANNITDGVEFKTDTDVATDEKCQALGDYLNNNQMHFMAVVPGVLARQMEDFYEKLTINGATFGMWAPYSAGTAEFVSVGLYNYTLSVATLVDNTQYRSCTFTAPGRYDITYWGTNYGGKVTKPITYQIDVLPDLAPIISGDVASKFLRSPGDIYNGKYRATIALTGPYSSRLGRDVLTITSPDGDYIDRTTVGVIWDANNNKIFTDSTDKRWNLTESTGTQLADLYYIVKKIQAK